MREIRIGLIGAGWMGKAHAIAYRNVAAVFGTEPAVPKLEVVADLNPAWAQAAAETLGFARWTADWREVVEDPKVDAIDITAPNHVHAEVALARARRRQAGLLREAAGQQRGRDPADGGGGQGRGRPDPGRLQLSEEPRAPLRARADPGRRARRADAVPRHLRSGSAGRPGLPVHLAPRAQDRRHRHARRHGLAHPGVRAIPDRRHGRGLRPARDLHPRAAGRGERHRPELARGGRRADPPGRERRRDPVPDALCQRCDRHDRLEPDRHRPQARARLRDPGHQGRALVSPRSG